MPKSLSTRVKKEPLFRTMSSVSGVDPSVTSIPDDAFYRRKKLTEVELCEGVVEIWERSFGSCNNSIAKINIPQLT
jgi:hypothetical protein